MAADVEWRYLPGRRVTHAIRRNVAAGMDSFGGAALCGARPWWGHGWRGTGSQLEYECAADLPRCKRCESIIDGGKR